MKEPNQYRSVHDPIDRNVALDFPANSRIESQGAEQRLRSPHTPFTPPRDINNDNVTNKFSDIMLNAKQFETKNQNDDLDYNADAFLKNSIDRS